MELEDVYEAIREDEHWAHLRTPGIVLVKGRGNSVDPLAMLVGEAPGATENTKRRPFCGPSGRVLTQLMHLAALSAEAYPELGVIANAFITNVVKYRPPGNRTPTVREVYFGTEDLRKEWKAVGRPRVIVAVGATARAALVPVPNRIKPGNWLALADGRTYVYVQYHPAWGLRTGRRGQALMEDQWEEMGLWLQSLHLD